MKKPTSGASAIPNKSSATKEEIAAHTKIPALTEQTIQGEVLLSSSSFQNIQNNPAIAYLASLRSKRSRKTMGSLLNIVAKMIGFKDIHGCAWNTMTRHHILVVLEILSDAGKAPTTINTYLSAIKGVAREAWTMKQIDTDTFQHIKDIRSVKGSRIRSGRALAANEIESLFLACENDPSIKGIRDAAIFGILIGGGLRRSEVVALDITDITKDKAIKVLGKGNKERLSYLPENTWERLEKWINERGDHDGPLFVRIRRFDCLTNDRLSSQAIHHISKTRSEEAGIEELSPHDFRRTFATLLLDDGEDLATVKDAMGHSSIATTQRYDRRSDERLKRASNRLNNFIKSKA